MPVIHPTQENWSLQFQQELPGKMVSTIGYVGSHSYHIGVWSKPNEINPAVAAQYAGAAANANEPLNAFLSESITSQAAIKGGVKLPFPNFVSAVGGAAGATVGQALRPFPQYGSVDNPINPIGSVSYNGLQTSLQRRFSNGLTFLVAYTFSKTLGNVDSNNGASSGAENAQYSASFYQDYYNPRAERSVTSSDIPQVLALNYTYELPVGKGKAFLNKGGITNEVLGGWEVAGIHQYQSGRPIHIEYDAFGNANPYRATDGYQLPTRTSSPDSRSRTPLYQQELLWSHRFCRNGPGNRSHTRQQHRPVALLLLHQSRNAFVAPAIRRVRQRAALLRGSPAAELPTTKTSPSRSASTLYERSNSHVPGQLLQCREPGRLLERRQSPTPSSSEPALRPDLSSASLANTTSVFGLMTDQQNGPRIIQFALKLDF